jgi:acetolactate synthase-1/2/3 large subunit
VIEICLDVQGALVDAHALSASLDTEPERQLNPTQEDVAVIDTLLAKAQRPLVLLGGLISRSAAREALPYFEQLGLPVATTTSAIDRVPSGSKVFAGRPGTWGGQRAGNLVLAQADFVLALGAQLDLQQTGFNYQSYAPQAKLVHVFPAADELSRTGPPAVRKVLASPDVVLGMLAKKLRWKDPLGWGEYVRQIRKLLPNQEPANTGNPSFINSFAFLGELSRSTLGSDLLALCSSGGTFTGALQNYDIAPGQVATTSAAHASMGYGLATAIGAAFADRTRRVVLTEGEGGFSQNLQELSVLKRFNLPVKIFLLENGGYASIRATQKKFFNGAYLGCDAETGLGFPDWVTLFAAYGIDCRVLEPQEAVAGHLTSLLNEQDGPQAWVVPVDPNQPNWPAVSTELSADGTLTSSPLYDMLPKLSDELLLQVGRYLPNQQP